MNFPDLPEIWYAFQRGGHGSFTIFNALVIECFYIDRLTMLLIARSADILSAKYEIFVCSFLRL